MPRKNSSLWSARCFSALFCLAICSIGARAGVPTDPAERAKIVGQPIALQVQPDSIALVGPRAFQQVIVTGQYADKTVRDLTALCEFAVEAPELAAISGDGYLQPRKDGTGAIVVKAGGQMVRVPLTVKDAAGSQPVSFRRELIASLNVGGCNAGACHGTPSGKGGFKLSLRGYDPAADFNQLTRDVFGRRTAGLEPESSLMLVKALGRVPHEGGQRFPPTSVPGQTIRSWLAEGLQDDPADLPALKQIQVLPGARVLNEPAKWQQLAVLARFADDSVRDVTRLTVFTTSDDSVAGVTNTGAVEFRQGGEVAILCRYLDQLQAVRFTYLEPRKGFVWNNPPEQNYVDKHVFAKLKMLNILPSEPCTDQEFIRRASLDLCATLPTADEVKAFLASADKDKRAKLVDSLLERSEYADFWTLKWADVLRNNRKTVQLKGAHVFHQWLREQIVQNAPFDQMVREILTANGSTFANPPANYYRIARDPQNLAETTAQLFCGVRMQCAKCHNHPFERWTQDDYYSLAAFFARVKQRKDPLEPGDAKAQLVGAEVIYSDRSGEVTQPRSGKQMAPKIIGVPAPTIPPGTDRREVLAEQLTSGANPFFPRSVVNRVWYHLNGKGIVDPVDDFRDSNPSANDELLDALAKDFVDHKFDVKYVIKVIMTSRTYQLSAQTNEFNRDDAKYFSHAVTKLLTAEQMLDAICTTTDMPEKFAGMPAGTRAIQLPDGDANHPFLKTFGQPARELACECERESDSNLAQALQLINGPTINDKLRNPNNRVGKLLAKQMKETDILNELFLVTLSRPPVDAEAKPLLEHVAKAPDKRKAWEDVHWALINSKEFLFRH
jgi:hypothetical protein